MIIVYFHNLTGYRDDLLCSQLWAILWLSVPESRNVLNHHLPKESESRKACGWFSLVLNLKHACLPRGLYINSSIFKIKLSLDKHHTFYIRHSIWKMGTGSNSECLNFFLICANVYLSMDYHLYLLQICCSWGWDKTFIISISSGTNI